MIAASFWSLLAPAIEMVEAEGGTAWLPAWSDFSPAAPFSGWSTRSCPISIPGFRKVKDGKG